MARTRPKKRLRDRNQGERHEAANILDGAPSSPSKVYDPDVHPAALLEYFHERYEQVVDSERNVDDKGSLKYVGVPVRVPTFAGFAVEIDVARETIWGWAKKHTEFGDAVDKAKAIQEAFLVEQGTLGALNPQMTMFSLKNLQGWSEKAEVGVHGHVELTFDGQDEEA